MPNGYAPEVERIPAGWTWQDYQAYSTWARGYYMPTILSQIETWAYTQTEPWTQAKVQDEAERQLKARLEDTDTMDWWRRFGKDAAAPTRDQYGILTPAEARRRFADMMERNVASGIWTEAQATSQAERFATSVAEHGITYETPFYGSLEQQVAPFTGRAAAAEQPALPRVLPGGGLVTNVGPLAFAGTRRPQDVGRRWAPGEYEAKIRASLPGLPSARGMMEEALEGEASPAMLQYFLSQFPYIYEKFGGMGRRIASQVAFKKRLGEASYLAKKRAGAQWVAGKKAEYLPQPTSPYAIQQPRTYPGLSTYQESYAASQATVKRLTGQTARAQARVGKWTDPWAGFLRNYPWLEKFIRIPPAQRGFFPSRFAPMTRWL